MAQSTGPVLAIGGITLLNTVVLTDDGGDVVAGGRVRTATRVVVGTGVLAGILAAVEKATPDIAVGLAWVAFATLMLTRTTPGTPSPTERLLTWWDATQT